MIYTFAGEEMTVKDLITFLKALPEYENIPLLFPNGTVKKIVYKFEENETPEDKHPGYLIIDMGTESFSSLGSWKLKI
jgi:hypothetical protein